SFAWRRRLVRAPSAVARRRATAVPGRAAWRRPGSPGGFGPACAPPGTTAGPVRVRDPGPAVGARAAGAAPARPPAAPAQLPPPRARARPQARSGSRTRSRRSAPVRPARRRPAGRPRTRSFLCPGAVRAATSPSRRRTRLQLDLLRRVPHGLDDVPDVLVQVDPEELRPPPHLLPVHAAREGGILHLLLDRLRGEILDPVRPDERGGVDQPGQLIARHEGPVQEALRLYAGEVRTVGEDRVADFLGVAEPAQLLDRPERMLVRVLLPVQVVQQTRNPPGLLVLAVLPRIIAERGLDRLHVVAEPLAFHPAVQQFQRFFTRRHVPIPPRESPPSGPGPTPRRPGGSCESIGPGPSTRLARVPRAVPDRRPPGTRTPLAGEPSPAVQENDVVEGLTRPASARYVRALRELGLRRRDCPLPAPPCPRPSAPALAPPRRMAPALPYPPDRAGNRYRHEPGGCP